ncbi:effector-associated constant component EACC1, partial [Streptomyces sp. NRRL S-1896]|uniref:effector-associated constant component EACC1 n=1 Tax=Streptomyces sp. NRRL S-1896 TaxID=1463893 RepID=UPI001F23A8A2
MAIRVVVAGEGPNGAHALRRWLSAEPQLRGRIRSGAAHAGPPGGAMGTAADALLAVLAPGGVAAVFAGAVVAWAQTRRGSQTITIIRPDGTEITVSATHVRGLNAQQTTDLARQLAADIGIAHGTVGGL